MLPSLHVFFNIFNIYPRRGMLCSEICLHVPFMFLPCICNPFFLLLVSFKCSEIFALLVLHQSHRRPADEVHHEFGVQVNIWANCIFISLQSFSFLFLQHQIRCSLHLVHVEVIHFYISQCFLYSDDADGIGGPP